MHPWLLSLAGGVLIGLAAVGLMATLGRVAGISGIAGSVLVGVRDWQWRAAFILGLMVSPLCLWLVRGNSGLGVPQVAWPWMALAGLLVGVGTRLGSGCTSGHGVCGIARLSPRSLVATVVFVALGMGTVAVIRHWIGGLPT